MKISEILKKEFTISFEFFPPKTEEGEKELFNNLKKLEPVKPSFVSVTYGAGGSGRDRTRRIVSRIAREEKLNVMAHLAVVGHTKKEALDIISSYKENEIDNILALRGDTPAGTNIDPDKGEIPHASDLIRLVRDNFNGYFSVGGAIFPEKHVESRDWENEMRFLKLKTEAGMEFGVGQLFFVNRHFFDFLERCEKSGIKIPMVPGIMPITQFSQVDRFAKMSCAEIPADFVSRLEKHSGNSEDVTKVGIDYAVRQCEELLKHGVRGLHFFTLNKSDATLRIYDAIKGKIPGRP
jgi:methylenetetrahydrofolate reductase (NADPH)